MKNSNQKYVEQIKDNYYGYKSAIKSRGKTAPVTAVGTNTWIKYHVITLSKNNFIRKIYKTSKNTYSYDGIDSGRYMTLSQIYELIQNYGWLEVKNGLDKPSKQ